MTKKNPYSFKKGKLLEFETGMKRKSLRFKTRPQLMDFVLFGITHPEILAPIGMKILFW